MLFSLLMVGCGEEAKKEAVQEEAKDDPSVPLPYPVKLVAKKLQKKTRMPNAVTRPPTQWLRTKRHRNYETGSQLMNLVLKCFG